LCSVWFFDDLSRLQVVFTLQEARKNQRLSPFGREDFRADSLGIWQKTDKFGRFERHAFCACLAAKA
jgi:hypothetical protein